eukprot:9483988-Pyramimonas_sp.AAC.2
MGFAVAFTVSLRDCNCSSLLVRAETQVRDRGKTNPFDRTSKHVRHKLVPWWLRPCQRHARGGPARPPSGPPPLRCAGGRARSLYGSARLRLPLAALPPAQQSPWQPRQRGGSIHSAVCRMRGKAGSGGGLEEGLGGVPRPVMSRFTELKWVFGKVSGGSGEDPGGTK